MAFDFDPLHHLDVDFDGIVTGEEIDHYGQMNGEAFLKMDMNQDMIFDKYQTDLNGNMLMDQYEFDINQNNLIDKYEIMNFNTTLQYDLNHDGKIDELDTALATVLFNK